MNCINRVLFEEALKILPHLSQCSGPWGRHWSNHYENLLENFSLLCSDIMGYYNKLTMANQSQKLWLLGVSEGCAISCKTEWVFSKEDCPRASQG